MSSPIRTCCTCRTRKSQAELIRIRWSGSFWFVREAGEKEPNVGGRSAYICPISECREGVFLRNRLARALKVSLSPSQLEELRLVMKPPAR